MSSYYYQGKINLAYDTSLEALRIAEESGDIWSKGVTYSAHGFSCFGKGMWEEAERHLLKGQEFCEKIDLHGWNAIAQGSLAELYMETGTIQKGKE